MGETARSKMRAPFRLDPFDSLRAAVAYFPKDRWTAPTLAAVLAIPRDELARLSPPEWATVLDEIEETIAHVLHDMPAKRLRIVARTH